MIHRHVWLTSTALGARGGAGGIPPCPEKHVAAAPPAPTLGSRCRCFPSPPSARSPAYRCKVTSARERGRLKSFPRGKEKKKRGGSSSAASLHGQKGSSTWQGKGLRKPTEVSQHSSRHHSSRKSRGRNVAPGWGDATGWPRPAGTAPLLGQQGPAPR